MTRPRLLDLFCGAGGAAMGYHRAGFEVVGVDIKPQPRYPFEFVQADAFEYLAEYHWTFTAIHASPPCQNYSTTVALHNVRYPRWIAPLRLMLKRIGMPYAIENVAGARNYMQNPVTLCGSSFGLGVRRHRLFETSWPIAWQPHCRHDLQREPIDVTGTGGPAARPRGQGGGIHRKPRNLAQAREVMGIDWMTRPELSEAIPPAFTAWLGEQLLSHLRIPEVTQ